MTHSDDVTHLAECSACRDRFAANVLPFDPAVRRGREREFASIAAKLERERDESSDVVARYLRDTPAEEWSRLAEMPDLRNNAALEQMSEEVRRRLHRKPREALAIANLSASIAESLSPSQYPSVILAQLRGTAWKDRASTLRYLARYDEALEAAQRGEEALAPFASLEYDRAIVRLVKGMILAQQERFEEAHAILSGCREVFREYGDLKRYVQSGMAEAGALYESNHVDEARQLWLDLLPHAVGEGDIETQARIHSNVGYCEMRRDEFGSANIHFSEAVAGFTDLGYTSEVARTERGAGLVLIARGQIGIGLARLHEARRAFTAAGMTEDSGLCGLNMAAVLLDRGDQIAARSLAQSVIDEFTEKGMSHRAIDALISLREKIDVDDATAETVHTVHAVVESLRDEFHGVAN
jgi:tetratricopeptide (TPR) repeat protein